MNLAFGGNFPTHADAEKVASDVPNVRTVVNELQIAGTSTVLPLTAKLRHHSDDALLVEEGTLYT